MATLIIRKDSKQAFAQGAKVTMLDGIERLAVWADALNQELGWNKYSASAAA